MKKKILALAISGILSASAQADVTDIIITEYVEGSSGFNNVAIELTNTGTTDYTFEDDVILEYSSFQNDVRNVDGDNIFEGQTIPAGDTLVIYNGGMDAVNIATITGLKVASTGFRALDDYPFNHLGFSGDDHVALKQGVNILDVIGIDGSDWGVDRSFRRNVDVNGNVPKGDTIRYIDTNWEETTADDFTDLGITSYGTYVPPAPAEIFKINDGESFKDALARYVGKEVIITSDLDDNESGDQGLVITRSFGFNVNGYVNNMSAAYKQANINPNQAFIAGSSFAANQENENRNNTLIIDSFFPAEDGEIAYYPTFHTDAANNHIRINDKITAIQGVIYESEFGYKLLVSEKVDSSNFEQDPRLESPELDTTVEDGHFAIKIATQNVLNLFNSPFGGDDNLHGDSRGANTEAEYLHQKAKLVEAIYGLDADIVGLMEIENNGFSDAGTIAEFVEAINAKYYNTRGEDSDTSESSTNKYAFIGFDSNGDTIIDELDSIGYDVITSGMIYRPSKVSLKATKIIPMPEQHAPATVDTNNAVVKNQDGDTLESGDNYQRDTVTATFVVNQTGKRLTVAVNHFKSKGSTCHEDWEGVDFSESQFVNGQYTNDEGGDDAPDVDFQGQCEHFRVAAAVQLGEELEKIGGDRVVIGDMNSYAKEDPILVLTENTSNKVIKTARDTFIGKTPQFNNSGDPITVTKNYGYVSAVEKKDAERGEVSWSYAYDDSIGSLDHILLTPSLESRLIDAKDWHINAAESTYYDYSTYRLSDTDGLVLSKGENGATNFVVDDEYRSSDHDPAIVALSYKYGEESSDQAIHLVIESGITEVPYVIPSPTSIEIGDIAEISLSSTADMSDILLPTTTITSDQQSLVSFEVSGINAGIYKATMTIVRDGQRISAQTKSVDFEVAKSDSLIPSLIVPEYDGSGGSFGIWGLLTLMGLGFLRRAKA